MSFPRYPKYKHSGVQWLGKIPDHWEALPIRFVARLESGHTPSRSVPAYWENCNIPWFTLSDVWQIRENQSRYIVETEEKISEVGLANSAARLLSAGTVMLSRTASVGFSAIMGVPMATTQDFANWVCGPRVQPEFLLWTLQSMEGEFGRLKMGSTHNTIYMPDIQSLRFALPPIAEQGQIVAFLDRETAKIDALVTEQRRLMELLKEKRQAVISHSVTKGLNPQAPMRNSEVEWLGEVPSHWKVISMRLIASIVRGASPRPAGDPRYFGGDAIPWVTVAEITKDDGLYLTETETHLTHEGAKHSNLFERGTLIYRTAAQRWVYQRFYKSMLVQTTA